MNLPRRTFRRSAARHAFTLVEITLALGIVSFAVLSILGAMSVGMNTIRDAKVDVTRAQIIAQVSGNITQTPFDQLEQFAAAGPYYFDQAARQLKQTGSTALYTATVQVRNPDSTVYPGAPGGLSSSAKLVAIITSNVAPGTTQVFSSSTTWLVVPKS